MENGRKCTGWKIKENTQLENARMENAQPRKCKKNHTPEIVRKITIRIHYLGNGQHENNRKL